MTHWIKRLLAAGATALALGSVTMAVSSPAYAAEEAKPAVTAPAAAAASAAPAAPAAPAPVANKGDTAWIMICTALVILMTLPGLGLFYGGLVRSKKHVVRVDAMYGHLLVDLSSLGGVWLQYCLHSRQRILWWI